MVKIDIKDFYMSGVCEELTNDVCSLFSHVPEQRLVKEAVQFLLLSLLSDY